MKALIVGTLLISSTSFAQNIDANGLKQLLTANKIALETVKQGMTKKVTTQASEATAQGTCDYSIISIQTILKVEGEKLVIHSKDKFIPGSSSACVSAGYRPFEENIVFYDKKSTLAANIADIDLMAANISSIVRAGNIVTMRVNVAEESYRDTLTIKTDVTKSGFKNVLLTEGTGYKIITEDAADVNVHAINLRNVLFCDNNDGDNSECMQGDFSDILY